LLNRRLSGFRGSQLNGLATQPERTISGFEDFDYVQAVDAIRDGNITFVNTT
jgi:hypothetical protein